MHKLLLLLVFIFLSSCSGEHRNNQHQHEATKKKPSVNSLDTGTFKSIKNINDTLFLVREIEKDFYHAVFIEKNRQSKRYDLLTDNSFSHDDSVTSKESYTSISKQYPRKIKKYNLNGLTREWMPLYRYKNKYYVYMPSEWGNLARRIICDSALVYWFMDGPYTQPLQHFEKVKENKYILTCRDPFKENKVLSQEIIYIIDPKNEIAVWENTGQKYPYRYALYIPKEKARNFDMIVNYCKEGKMGEFDFDKVDFQKLLKTSNNPN